MVLKSYDIIEGKHQKPIVTDVSWIPSKAQLPIVIFCHGYKGFKDWGAWNLMADTFAKAGFIFIKFNFSHNGGTVEQPIDFPDLEAFAHNNYTKELDDLETVIDWAINNDAIKKVGNLSQIALIGHSRAGGIVSIKAEENPRITHVISLAGVCDFGKRTATKGNLETWKKSGVKYVRNGRTNQQMPHYYQFYEDFIKHEERLTIKRAVINLKIPHLIIHGRTDTSVFLSEAEQLHSWNPKSELKIIENTDHVFGAKHPWEKDILPEKLEISIAYMISFIRN